MSRSRVPPNSPESEAGVLGSILQDPLRVLDLCIQHKLHVDCFHAPANRVIFTEMGNLLGKGKPVDILTVTDRLVLTGKVGQAGGSTALEDLIDKTPTSAHAGHYIEEVMKKYKLRCIISCCSETMESAYDAEDDAETIIHGLQNELHEATRPPDTPTTNDEASADFIQTCKDAKDGNLPGLPFLIQECARRWGSWRLGKPYYIGGRPSEGKSTYLINQFDYWSYQMDIPCAIASVEMEHEEVMGIILCEQADVSRFAAEHGLKDSMDGDRVGMISRTEEQYRARKAPLYIHDRIQDFDAFESWARLMKRKHDVQAIGLDYLQILEVGSRCKGKTAREKMEYLANGIRRLSKELHVLMIAVSQLSGPSAEGGKPRPADLFGSKSLQQAAYGVMMAYEIKEKEDDGVERTRYYLDMQKHRGGGYCSIEVDFNKSRQRWVSRHDPRGTEDMFTPGSSF